jgi:hypothetical protein
MRTPIRSDAFTEWRAIPGPHGWHLTSCRPFAVDATLHAPHDTCQRGGSGTMRGHVQPRRN